MACIRALYMQDIFLSVLDQMPCHGYFNRPTVARLARVCRAFSDPALQSLWRTLDSIDPLLRLLTGFKRVVAETEDFEDCDDDSNDERYHQFVWALQGDIRPVEWERFRQYAKRVRSLRHYGHDLDESVLFVLSYCQQSNPLLPQLRKLNWSQLSDGDVTLFPLISPSLRDLSLKFRDRGQHGRPTRRQYVLESILRYIASKAPAIEGLSVDGITQASSLLLLAEYRQLRRLHLHGTEQVVDAPFLKFLAGMANLSDLRISIGDVEGMPISFCTGFSQLESISLQGGQQPILSFLEAISPPLLHTISLDYQDIQGHDGCRKVMTGLALCTKFTALCRLIVRCSQWVPRLYLEGAAFTFIDLIRPLFVMGQLEEINFQFEKLAIHIPDADFYELTSAWPRMKAFTLHCHMSKSMRPSISALVPFARRCPDLKSLALPSLGDGASDTILPETIPATSHGLRELTFRHIPTPVDEDKFLRSVYRLFPNLDTTSRHHMTLRSFLKMRR